MNQEEINKAMGEVANLDGMTRKLYETIDNVLSEFKLKFSEEERSIFYWDIIVFHYLHSDEDISYNELCNSIRSIHESERPVIEFLIQDLKEKGRPQGMETVAEIIFGKKLEQVEKTIERYEEKLSPQHTLEYISYYESIFRKLVSSSLFSLRIVQDRKDRIYTPTSEGWKFIAKMKAVEKSI